MIIIIIISIVIFIIIYTYIHIHAVYTQIATGSELKELGQAQEIEPGCAPGGLEVQGTFHQHKVGLHFTCPGGPITGVSQLAVLDNT